MIMLMKKTKITKSYVVRKRTIWTENKNFKRFNKVCTLEMINLKKCIKEESVNKEDIYFK